MKTVATQFGISASADFEEITWTFEMPENFNVWAGEFAIVDKTVYDELLNALERAKDIMTTYNLMNSKAGGFIESAIKKATE